jgi:uncharacterized LabA/DUF88 family protein
VSKNVAVFVDVANIFYAAKAAGVDIDYVTLLKSSVAGRDFVRAYAYTGLDPDNENQRQFHSFLSRNGYKVVSKDIRKYGDGRIKANLDIELVVDLMRLARNLDIAVVVSGDGDFAPAIRAVQQMGVRVEVVSFRGNTSSDLIEVADSFTDIAHVARVDKGSARSGRRVAAEGDLSMTEVPEKETEGSPRRQRGRRTERPAAVATLADSAGLVVLPGERLSRAGEGEPEEAEVEAETPGVEEGEEVGSGDAEQLGEEARRRRRRRGGRGRGRGRRTEVDVLAGSESGSEQAADGEEEDEEEAYEEVAPAPLPQHTFGSVWDSQLGMPSAPLSSAAQPQLGDDDAELDEPEIPEYLLAERRQRSQRGGQRGQAGRGRGAGYQAALDRERYGRSGVSSGGFGAGRSAERQRPDRGRGGRQQRPARPERPQRQHQDRAAASARPVPGTPWSEVPPELEELLRAELARKVDQPANGPAPRAAQVESPPEQAEEKPKRATRRRTTKTADEPAAAASASEVESPPEQAEEKPKRATRRRTTKTADEPAEG